MEIFRNNNKTLRDSILITIALVITFLVGLKIQGLHDANIAIQEELERVRAEVVYVEPQTIEDFIKYTFGPDADKAMLLLKGQGEGTCAENRHLNWDVQNYNADGSVDIGVFQVNSYWQKVQPKFLYNWRVNVLIAKQLFDESGSFKLWSCGKWYGI